MNKQTKATSSSANKKRFNFVDVALILLIIGFIVTLVYFFSPVSKVKKMGKTQEKSIEYTVEIIGVDKTFVENIKEGDTLLVLGDDRGIIVTNPDVIKDVANNIFEGMNDDE